MKKTRNINLEIHFSQKTRDKHDLASLKRCLIETLQKYSDDSNLELAVFFVSAKKMRQLNLEFRHQDLTTDVLSFPQIDLPNQKAKILGDIIICPEVAKANAQKFQRTYQQEIEFLAAHGTKHLLGIHHE